MKRQVIECGRLQLDMLADVVSWRGEAIKLPPKESHVLGMLILGAGEVVPTDEIINEIWHDPHPSTRPYVLATLTNHIMRLRQKLGAEAICCDQPSESLPRGGNPSARGYYLNAEVVKGYQGDRP